MSRFGIDMGEDDDEPVTIELGPEAQNSAQNSAQKSAQTSGQAQGGFGGLASSIGARNLMIAIVTMPLVFILVVVAIVGIFGGETDDETALAASSVSAAPASQVRSTPVETLSEPAVTTTPAAVAGVAPEAIALPEGAVAGAISLDGERLAVRVDGPDGASILIYDLGLGAVVQTVPILAEDEAN